MDIFEKWDSNANLKSLQEDIAKAGENGDNTYRRLLGKNQTGHRWGQDRRCAWRRQTDLCGRNFAQRMVKGGIQRRCRLGIGQVWQTGLKERGKQDEH